MKDMLFEFIKVCQENNIHIVAMVSDMSSDNQALWSQLGVYANNQGDNVLVPHPLKAGEFFVLMDDTTHALKNFKQAILKYKVNFNYNFVVMRIRLTRLNKQVFI